MGQKQRIKVNIGKDQKLNVELQQDFGLLEILSLKLTQQDIYTSICADYGVVCGRVTVNNGYGVPNARVSIFVPQLAIHEEDPVISELYPYKSLGDKTEDGFRYNLLPAARQHSGHEATGTFPDQTDVLTREEVLEVFETYYKYTVKTNDAGDFMIWGVPLGEQLIHVDLDVSDMGCFSLRPDDFLRKGYGTDQFKSPYEFTSSEDIDSLPQIVTFDKGIEVYPFWGSEDLCEIGITRVDFDLSELGLKIEPSAMLIGGSFTDDGKSSINKNCVPRKDMGKKCSLTTQSGKIEAIRFGTFNDEEGRPILEELKVNEDITDDGAFAVRLPMNMNYVFTNEFGENDYTNDPNKGIPTAACYRLRLTLNDEGLERVRARASYLVPNIREYKDNGSFEKESYAWSTDWNDYPQDAIDPTKNIIFNNVDGDYYPQDYFYRFQYGKVYTVSSFQSLLFTTPRRILAINDIAPTEDKDCSSNVVTPPVNMGIRNTAFNFQLLLALVLTFLQFAFAVVSVTVYEFLATLFEDLSDIVEGLGFKKFGQRLSHGAIEIQEAGQTTLPLTIYDNCDECTVDDTGMISGFDGNNYCKIGEYDIVVTGDGISTYFIITGVSENTALGSSHYTSGSARHDCDSYCECEDSYSILDSGYTSLNTETVEQPPGSGIDNSRFTMFLGGNSGSTIGGADFFISNTPEDYTKYTITNIGLDYGFVFNDVQVRVLFGIESGSTYFFTNAITSDFYGYITDSKYPLTGSTSDGLATEEECAMYDTLYNEQTASTYIWLSGATEYGDPKETPPNNQPVDLTYIKEQVDSPGNGWTIGATVFSCLDDFRLPRYVNWSKLGYKTYERKTKSGYSEFRDGVFVIVPSRTGRCQKNYDAIREWYRRKLIGINFCGGIVNYAYADNWLSGALYFFQFKAKIKDKKDGEKVKVCETVVRYIPEHERFYYRSCLFDSSNDTWGYDNNHGNDVYLGHPTTFVDLGPRDEFIKEICTDPSLDPNCSVSRSIGPTSFKSFGELIAFAVNYKMDVRNGDMEIYDFFKNDGFYKKNPLPNLNPIQKNLSRWIFNGDVIQLVSINSEAGIDGFDMQNQKYMGYSISTLDPEVYPRVFTGDTGTGQWGPTPVTLKYEDDGVRIRQCLNAPGYLTEASQIVPFYLWNKGASGFGPYNPDTLDDQCWAYNNGVHLDYLQGMAYNYKYSGGTLDDPDDAYLLPPISYDFSGVTISAGTNVSGQTEEFNEVIYPLDHPNDAHYDYDDVLHNYDTMYLGFTILLATQINGTIMNPEKGRLYVKTGHADGNGAGWSVYLNWSSVVGDGENLGSIWPSSDPYGGNVNDFKQILSTPFMFYFGLRPSKTGLDMLIARFGPKGAFTPIE